MADPNRPFKVVGSFPGFFQAQVHPLPTGDHVLFTAARVGGLAAALLSDLDTFGPNITTMRTVYSAPKVHPIYPWICYTNDWGATVLPDGSVLALFRNGGRHCPENSYPGWPDEQLGLMRASCWNCSDYRVITPTPLFQSQPSGASNEDGFLWWSHRGIHMVLHSQDTSDPKVPHQVRGTVAFSPDVTTFAPESWVISTVPAYNQTIPLANGSALTALRRQRPQLVVVDTPNARPIAPNGWPRRNVTHLSNSVDLVYGNNSDGWGNAWALLQPLRQ